MVAGYGQRHWSSLHYRVSPAKPVEQVEPPHAVARVKTGQRIIEQEHFRLQRQGASQTGALLEIPPKSTGGARGPGREASQFEQGFCLGLGLSHGQVFVIAER